jgi:hypothetical protein
VEAISHIHNPMIRDALMARDPFIIVEKRTQMWNTKRKFSPKKKLELEMA